jgi:hypothetical protein
MALPPVRFRVVRAGPVSARLEPIPDPAIFDGGPNPSVLHLKSLREGHGLNVGDIYDLEFRPVLIAPPSPEVPAG